jgi:hypothetical protein
MGQRNTGRHTPLYVVIADAYRLPWTRIERIGIVRNAGGIRDSPNDGRHRCGSPGNGSVARRADARLVARRRDSTRPLRCDLAGPTVTNNHQRCASTRGTPRGAATARRLCRRAPSSLSQSRCRWRLARQWTVAAFHAGVRYAAQPCEARVRVGKHPQGAITARPTYTLTEYELWSPCPRRARTSGTGCRH